MQLRSRSLAVRSVLLTVAVVLAGVAAPQGRQSRLSPWLDTAVRQARATDRLAVWVYFADKGPSARAGGPGERAGPRPPGGPRRRRPPPTAFEDRPLVAGYVQRVAALVSRVRQQSRWFNAVSVEATPAADRAPSRRWPSWRAGRRAPLPAGPRRER